MSSKMQTKRKFNENDGLLGEKWTQNEDLG